tara:strand:- start:270 stop:1283 length:1014 start_codon:yes stop_codon:yes gene_type:complete
MKKTSLFVAEIALSHEGSIGNACALMDLAKNNNIDIVKFQDHWARYESSKDELFRVPIGFDKTRYEYWERTEFDQTEWSYIYDYAKKININIGFSIFSPQSFFRQKKLGNHIWKLGSGELLNNELIDILIKELNKKDTVIISTGLCEYSYALNIAEKFSSSVKEVFILDCISEYPCNYADYSFKTWLDQSSKLKKISYGLSDHSGEIWPTIFSWSYGCKMNEFHITFDKKMFGPDQKSSLDPSDLKNLNSAREAFNIISRNEKKKISSLKKNMINFFGRSIGLKNSLPKGHILRREDLLMRKPNGGFSFKDLENIIGKKLKIDLNYKEILKSEHFEK